MASLTSEDLAMVAGMISCVHQNEMIGITATLHAASVVQVFPIGDNADEIRVSCSMNAIQHAVDPQSPISLLGNMTSPQPAAIFIFYCPGDDLMSNRAFGSGGHTILFDASSVITFLPGGQFTG